MLQQLSNRPVAAVLFGAFLISFSAIWVKISGLSPTAAAFYRVFIGAMCLLLPSIQSGDFPKLTQKRFNLLMLCAAFFALDLVFWHGAIHFIGPGLATMIGNFQVFVMAAVAVFYFKEPLRLRLILSLPIAAGGLYLIVGPDWQLLDAGYKTGLMLGLLTAFCYSGFLLSLRKIQAETTMSFYNSLMLMSAFCAGLLAIYMVIKGESFAFPTLQAFISMLLLGLFSQALGWLMITNAMPKISPALTGLVLLLQPSLSFIWDVVIFRRPTDLINWIGVLITIGAIYMGISKNGPSAKNN